MKPWSIKNRTRLFWSTVWRGRGLRTLWHNIRGPSNGCSCTFCFYSKRRKFPPGHPMHPTQLMAAFDKRLDDHIVAVRVRWDRRHDRIWGGRD